MFRLTDKDVQYFSNEDVWRCGPMLQFELVFEDGYDTQKIDSEIRRIPNFLFWSETAHSNVYHSIFFLSEESTVGTRNCMFDRNLGIRRAIFEIGIRPYQYERLIGAKPDEEHSHECSVKLKKLIDAFAEISVLIASKYPLIFSYVNTEVDPSKYAGDKNFYLSTEISKNLGLEGSDIQTNDGGSKFISFSDIQKRLETEKQILIQASRE